jgi:hypothetical protein
MIVTGYAIEIKFKKNDFGNKYASYVANTYGTGRLDGGDPPWERVSLSSKQQSLLFSDLEFNSWIHGQHIVVLWYVLAHEVAHHVLRHNFDRALSLSDSRRQEKEADTWASEVFIKLGIPPAVAYASFLYWYHLDQNSVRDEHRRTHPPDLKRIRWMLQESINRSNEWNSIGDYFPILSEGMLVDTTKSYRHLLYYIEDLISQQSMFNSDDTKTETLHVCIKIMYEGCLKSCQEEYGHSLSSCKSKYCNTDRSRNIWKLRCKELME